MKDTVDDLLKKTFIKLRSDYGFKRAFATPKNAEVLRKFLNALFEGRMVITDFDMRPFEHRLVNEIVLMERDTHVVFTEDFKIFFLSLAQVNEEWDGCRSELERQLYLVKNMEKLNKESKPYISGEYEDIFNASEIASMAAEDIVAYRSSIMIEMERQSALEFAKEEGKEEGREEGRAEGREEGIEAGKMEVAREMKKKGMLLGDIMLFTGLSEQQIEKL